MLRTLSCRDDVSAVSVQWQGGALTACALRTEIGLCTMPWLLLLRIGYCACKLIAVQCFFYISNCELYSDLVLDSDTTLNRVLYSDV